MEKLWLRREEALALTGLGDKAFRSQVQSALKTSEVRRSNGRGQALEFWAPAIVEKLLAMAAQAADPDPLLGGGDSPALERYRSARAGLAELDLREREKTLIDVEAFNGWWGTMIEQLQREFGLIGRKHGNEVLDALETAIHNADRAVAERFNNGVS